MDRYSKAFAIPIYSDCYFNISILFVIVLEQLILELHCIQLMLISVFVLHRLSVQGTVHLLHVQSE